MPADLTHLDETDLCEAVAGVIDASNLIEKMEASSGSSSSRRFSDYQPAERPASTRRGRFGEPPKQ